MPAMPAVRHLLARLRRRMVALIWLHGLGTVVAASVLWLGVTFLLDWGLHVPVGVRLVHLAVLVALPAVLLWRDLVRPLRRLPDRAGLALLVERRNPELEELLVSATQLAERIESGRPVDGDPALVRLVLEDAERRARDLRLAGVLRPRGPRLRMLAALSLCTLLALGAMLRPDHAAIFAQRLLGGATPWPQRTHLAIEIPVVGELAQVTTGEREIHVRVARGSDVPVLVRATGVVPDDVTLRFDGGQDVVLASNGGGLFRTVLRSCQEDLRFHAEGGDDEDGLPEVLVEVLQPPDVTAVALRVEPPAYTGLAPRLVATGDAEVVAGSRIEVHLVADPPGAHGRVRLLPTDEVIDLVPMDFPALAAEGAGDGAGGEPRPGLGFELVAERSLRYRFELQDATGLSNPDPGLYAITVAEDRAPTVQVLSPARSDFETVPGGSLALRVVAEDDFGLAAMTWEARPTTARAREDEAEPPSASGSLKLERLADEEDGGAEEVLASSGAAGDAAGAPLRHAIAGARIELASLAAPDEPLEEGRQFLLEVAATDVRRPEPGVGRSAPVRLRVVSPETLLRRVQDRLTRARIEAGELAQLQREKRSRVEELLDGLESDSLLEGGDGAALQTALTGQRRVLGDARSLSRELASVTSSVLYARLDEKADAMLEQLDRAMSRVTDRHFHPEVWSRLAADHEQGRLGSPGLAGRLTRILTIALAISEEHTSRAEAELDRAQSEVEMAGVVDALLAAADAQTRALEEIEVLLERLSEWDNFQSVLMLSRDILGRQKALLDRTKQIATDK